MRINFIIPGPPQGKARPKVTRTKNGFSHTYTPDKTVAYEELVRQRFWQTWQRQELPFPGKIPVRVIITAYFQPPKSAGKTKREDMLAGICKPTKRPDVDNIVKIILDALNGFAWHDDAQVTTASAVSAGNQTATAIKASYVPLDLKTDKFEAGVTDFILGILKLAGIDDQPTYNRNQIINKSEETQTVLLGAPYYDDEYITKKLLTILGDADQYDGIVMRKDAEDMERLDMVEKEVVKNKETSSAEAAEVPM